jgi:Fur family peroxide stress response transcriptional regulator
VVSDIQNATVGQANEKLAHNGFRLTPQRQHVYQVLLERRDHPTAEEVFLRTKAAMPEISMATVYNCLDALVRCGLVRQVNLDRAATRYCPNMREHSHFYCEGCGGIFDVEPCAGGFPRPVELPRGFKALHYELSIRGFCQDCFSRQTG